jgi:hypothetical protein
MLETYQSVLSLRPYSKAKHCWVCTIILRDPDHRQASVFNRRYKDTNCCERCVETGGQVKREKWLYQAVVDECENRDMSPESVDELFNSILSGIKYY